MTTQAEPKRTSGYCPEGYAAHLNHLLNCPRLEGSTQADVRASEREVIGALIDVAVAYATVNPSRAEELVAELLPPMPAELSPLRFFEAVAEQMALPVWDQYTAVQRERGFQYAARYVSHKLNQRLAPRSRVSGTGEVREKFELTAMTRAQQWAYTEVFMAKTEYRRWLTQVQAYMATHPDGEVVPAQLRAIMDRWEDFRSEQAFF